MIALAKDATPGPWKWNHGLRTMSREFNDLQKYCGQDKITASTQPGYHEYCIKSADADYIVACDPESIAFLCKSYLELKWKLKVAEDAMQFAKNYAETEFKEGDKGYQFSIYLKEALSELEKEV